MKIEINDIEYKNNQLEIAVLLTHPKKETILILSKNLLTSEIYLEWNGQSNAVYGGITEVQINGNILVINLNDKGTQKIGNKTIQVKLSLTKEDYNDFLENMNFIFDKCLRLTDKPFAPSKSKSIDFSKIKYHNLDGKNLTLPPENLEYYVALEKLFIRDNPTLDVNATIAVLAKLPHLKQLQLTINGNIPHDLSKLTALESLHIEGDADFETLPTDIGNLKKLSYIYLQSKKPIMLPPQFSDLTALEFLHVRSKTWKLPDNFYKLYYLKHLDLYNCNITVFPSEMSQMTHLETIILGRNQERDDSKLFTVLGQLAALRTIEIDISSLPESISDCTQIENLEVYGNDSQGQKFYIPKSFGRLTQLKSLTLENCIFDQLPECLFDVVSLQRLNLTNCLFAEIPGLIAKLQQLEEISIIDCLNFSVIHSDFSKLKSLKKIYFENVPALQSLPTELHNLTDIDELYLSEHEKIGKVPDHWIKIMNENGG